MTESLARALTENIFQSGAYSEITFLLKATVVLALGLALLALARRARAAARHVLIAATFGALMLLPVALWLSPFIRFAVPVPNVVMSYGAATPDRTLSRALVPSTRILQPQPAVSTRPPITLPALLRMIWLFGALVILMSIASGLRRLTILRRIAVPFRYHRPLIAELAARAGVRPSVEVLLHPGVAAPFTYGAIRPVILLPADAARWSECDLRSALVHELEHLHRRDWVVHLAAHVACAFYWFHPLVWKARRSLSIEAERACDDAVLRQTQETKYAAQLVLLARRITGRLPRPILAMASGSDLSARISAILNSTQRRGRIRMLPTVSVATLGALAVVAMAPFQAVGVDTTNGIVHGAMQKGPCRAGRWDQALFTAAERGVLRDITTAIAAGANVNCALDGDGTPMIKAASKGQLAAVRLLLDNGADPDLAVAGDGSPLISAAAGGHLEIAELLLDRGAKVDRVVPGDENPLIRASGNGRLAVVRLLVARGADVNVRVGVDPTDRPAGGWRTALRMARLNGHDDVVAFLIAAGATR